MLRPILCRGLITSLCPFILPRIITTRRLPYPATRPFTSSSYRPHDEDGSHLSDHYASEMGSLDVLADLPVPKSSVVICTPRGFRMYSGQVVENGDAVMMVNDQVFHWKPWKHERLAGKKKIFNGRGQLDLPKEVFRIFEKMEEKPDMIIIGSGPSIAPMTKEMRQIFADLKMRFDVLDTRNAAAQYNLLATERGPEHIAAALFPMGWKDGVGIPSDI